MDPIPMQRFHGFKGWQVRANVAEFFAPLCIMYSQSLRSIVGQLVLRLAHKHLLAPHFTETHLSSNVEGLYRKSNCCKFEYLIKGPSTFSP